MNWRNCRKQTVEYPQLIDCHRRAMAAAWLEGEGCLGRYGKKKPNWAIDVCSTDVSVIAFFLETFQGGCVYVQAGRWNRTKPLWHWRVHRVADVYMILDAVFPYMITPKRDKAESMMEEIRRLYAPKV